MSEVSKKKAAKLEPDVEVVSTTLHAEGGASLYVCIDWNAAAAVLHQIEDGAAGVACVKLANELGLEYALPLPFPAILEANWLCLLEELRPLLIEGKREWRPVMAGGGASFRGVLSPRGEEIRREIFEKVTSVVPGEGVLAPIDPVTYLRERARWDEKGFRYEVPGLGTIGPTPDYPRIAKLADELPRVAQAEGYVLTDDGHQELLALAEHAFTEYLDPKNYPAEVQAESRAMEAEAAGDEAA